MIVYLLEVGAYSDKHIAGVFTTKESAEKAQLSYKMFGNSYYSEEMNIQEYETDMLTDIETVTVAFVNNELYSPARFQKEFNYELDNFQTDISFTIFHNDKMVQVYSVTVGYNPDPSVIRKSAYDKYAQIKAQENNL